MIREAVPADAPALEDYLSQYPETSMFLRSNLSQHGVGFGASEHSSRYFLWGTDQIEGVFGLTKKGYLMVQLPGCEPEAAAGFAKAIAGETVLGMTGVAPQVQLTLDALGLGGADYRLFDDEPLYRIDLQTAPDCAAPARTLIPTDAPLIEAWFADYFADTGQAHGEEAQTMAVARFQSELQGQRTIVLLEQDKPVAMAAVNASVADQIQVGGVFVPRHDRTRGLGRQVTLALMKRARSQGARWAILFANNPPAARVYEAIGFQQVGWYRIALLQNPEQVMT
ncbi:GNAT family N-acetyltransferase [Ruegeria sp. HKCCD7255]|uniref:GNAT family N-acetyltransferase n=1 Tax=Ruegeria sp. HKCCD7255 TaxID=2683004 RepID=UPI0014885D55|nr:GNAT family N-acetyltransferase [Ruegeria sp. HKCCD7255]